MVRPRNNMGNGFTFLVLPSGNRVLIGRLFEGKTAWRPFPSFRGARAFVSGDFFACLCCTLLRGETGRQFAHGCAQHSLKLVFG